MSDVIYEVLVRRSASAEIKKGKRRDDPQVFPRLSDREHASARRKQSARGRTWYFIRDTPGVIGFAGQGQPIPMRQSEVDNMLAQMKRA